MNYKLETCSYHEEQPLSDCILDIQTWKYCHDNRNCQRTEFSSLGQYCCLVYILKNSNTKKSYMFSKLLSQLNVIPKFPSNKQKATYFERQGWIVVFWNFPRQQNGSLHYCFNMKIFCKHCWKKGNVYKQRHVV